MNKEEQRNRIYSRFGGLEEFKRKIMEEHKKKCNNKQCIYCDKFKDYQDKHKN